MHDIYKKGFNFLFGLARLRSGVGIFSFHRQDPASPSCEFWNGGTERQPVDDALLLRRAAATLCHEISHTFGLKHCTFFRCLMQGSNSLGESESRGLALCPVCLRKLTWNLGISPADRYFKLLRAFEARPSAFGTAAAWIRRRISLARLEEKAFPPSRVGGSGEKERKRANIKDGPSKPKNKNRNLGRPRARVDARFCVEAERAKATVKATSPRSKSKSPARPKTDRGERKSRKGAMSPRALRQLSGEALFSAVREAILRKWYDLGVAWKVLDANRDGRIDIREFRKGLEAVDFDWLNERVTLQLWRNIDQNEKGYVSFTEFRRALGRRSKSEYCCTGPRGRQKT